VRLENGAARVTLQSPAGIAAQNEDSGQRGSMADARPMLAEPT